MTRRNFIKWLIAAVWASILTLSALFMFRRFREAAGHENITKPATATPQVGMTEAKQATEDAGPLLSFFIISDLHVNSGISAQSNHLRKALDDIKTFRDKAQAIMITGDITDSGTPADYREFKNIMSQYELPRVYANMGNHDYYNVWIGKNGAWSQDTFPNGKTDAMARQAFTSMFNLEKPYHDVRLNGFHFILLSQETYVQEKPEVGEGAWYSDEQLNWFRSKMAENKDGKPVFVMIHQELPPVGQDGGNHMLIKAREFREILKPYRNVFVFSGHTHQDFTVNTEHYIKETFHWFKNSSIGIVMNTKYENVRKGAAQGLFVEVYTNKVVLRGREFSNRTWIKEADWAVPLSD
ncbi:metallophosphoesterase family protein [Paenibacillus sp. Soil787]|uniref:metallophosphoesterase family protein n=1 Tax=Paenibacillus sp. Soil787 TaxID=1736411 RepID=UPI0006FA66FC|nr:metallophosphoesterase [Paenibacillus sp. Soil787]KRF43541.1 phosphohydrolase [Paenibacillus sp. Soil787]